MGKSISIFISYAHEDEELCKQLENHLSLLRKQNPIDVWHNRNISAGTDWAQESSENLNTAQIILLLISPDFMASDYCYSIEMMRAMERHEAKTACAIPVILRPADMEKAPFSKLKALPTNSKPITEWANQDKGFVNVVESIRKIIEGQDPASVHPAKSQANLPLLPRRNEFLGRKKDVAKVMKGLTGPERLISIVGWGGVGKSALARYIAHSCLKGRKHLFSYVVWVSAKDHLEQQLQPSWLNSIIDTIANELGHPSMQSKDEIHRLLRSHRTLVVLDNFETMKGPELEDWIEDIPYPSKVLMTSRSEHWQNTWTTIDLNGLDERSALEFIREEAKRLKLPRADRKEDLLPLAKVTGGNPLAIKLALVHVKRGTEWADVIKGLQAAQGSVDDVFKQLFSWSWEKEMSKEAQNLLMVTTLFADNIGREELEAASGLASDSLKAAIEELVDLRLLDINRKSMTSTPRYSTHPLTRSFAAKQLSNSNTFEIDSIDRWINYYLEFYTKLLIPEDPPEALKKPYWRTLMERNFADIQQEWPHMQKLLAWAAYNRDELLVDLMLLLVHYMDTSFHYADRLLYSQKAAEAADRLGKRQEATLFYIDGSVWILIEEDRLAEAKVELVKGLNILLSDSFNTVLNEEQAIVKGLNIVQNWDTNNPETVNLIGLAITFLARVYLEQGDIEKASQNMNLVLSGNYDPVIQVRVEMIAGEIEHKKHHYGEDLKHYKVAESISRSYEKKGFVDWDLHHRMGFALLEVDKITEAEELFKRVLNYYHSVGMVTIETIRAKYGLARIAQKRQKKYTARYLAEDASKDLSNAVTQHQSHQLLNEIQIFLKELRRGLIEKLSYWIFSSYMKLLQAHHKRSRSGKTR